MRILGGKNHKKMRPLLNGEAVWRMEEMTNAFRFFLAGAPERELFIEHDEIIAAGTAYSDRPPLNILDVLNRLEKLAPDFTGLNISDGVLLIRKRMELSPGLALIVDNQNKLFLNDATLATINFLDFCQEYLTLTPE